MCCMGRTLRDSREASQKAKATCQRAVLMLLGPFIRDVRGQLLEEKESRIQDLKELLAKDMLRKWNITDLQ